VGSAGGGVPTAGAKLHAKITLIADTMIGAMVHFTGWLLYELGNGRTTMRA
jgi:hypothetical protein